MFSSSCGRFVYNFHVGAFFYSSCAPFLYNPHANMMQNPLLPAFLLPWAFLIESLCKYEANSSLVCLPPQVGLSYTILLQIRCETISCLLSSSCGPSLYNPYANMMLNIAKSSLVCFPSLVGLSYTILIVGLSSYTKSSLVCLPALVRRSYTILMQL